MRRLFSGYAFGPWTEVLVRSKREREGRRGRADRRSARRPNSDEQFLTSPNLKQAVITGLVQSQEIAGGMTNELFGRRNDLRHAADAGDDRRPCEEGAD